MKLSDRMERVLCIDLDNCPNQILELPQVIKSFRKVIICYAGKAPKVPLNYLPLFANSVQKKQLEVFQMPTKGKNASDFGLTFHAGRVVAEMSANAEFVVVSKDGDLDHLVALLKAMGRKASRVTESELLESQYGGSSGDDPETSAQPSADPKLEEAVEEFRLTWLSKSNGRPAKKAKLLNSIRSCLPKKGWVKAQSVLQELVRAGDITIDNGGRIEYHDSARQAEEADDDDDADVPF